MIDTQSPSRSALLDDLRDGLEPSTTHGPWHLFLALGAATAAAGLTATVTGSVWEAATMAVALLVAVAVAAVLI